MNKFRDFFKTHYRLVVGFVCFGILVVGVLYQSDQFKTDTTIVSIPVTSTDLVPVLSAAEPTRLRIERINLETLFTPPLGLEDTGEVSVPDSLEEVGWYKYSPTPGELGPAVVLGHVDSVDGPAVFYSLGQLLVGDEIFIDRSDGTTARFVVERLERYEQASFPTEEVYGNIDYAGLRLITCSGTYERGKQRYTHNLVVYARLQE